MMIDKKSLELEIEQTTSLIERLSLQEIEIDIDQEPEGWKPKEQKKKTIP